MFNYILHFRSSSLSPVFSCPISGNDSTPVLSIPTLA